jgi:hypothetical protein
LIPRRRLISPEAVPKKKKRRIIQGLVFSHLSSIYPKKRPTTMEEGNIRAKELTLTSFRKSGLLVEGLLSILALYHTTNLPSK